MLLDFMRRNTRNLLIATIALIVPAFILWGTVPTPGTRDKRTIVKIGKEKVSLDEFTSYYQSLREMTRSNLGANYTPELEKMLNLKQQALDRLIRDRVLRLEVNRLNIVVSDEEIQDSIRSNRAFYTDGKFDAAKWNAMLNDPRIDWNDLVNREREALRFQNLMQMVSSQARVTEEEIREEYRRQNEKASIEYAALHASEFTGQVELSQDDLASYYEQHKQEYAEPALVKLAYVELKKQPSQMDFDDVKHVAQRILERIRAGDDFAELAEKYSDDTATAPKGGTLDFFGRGRMAKEYEDAAFSLNPGEISEPILSPDGYHIIRVEETRGEGDKKEVRARHILIRVEPSDDTLLSLEEQAAKLSVFARQTSLEGAASKMKLELSTTPMFAETDMSIPVLGVVPEVAEILPGLDDGKISDVIEARNAFYVVQVSERKPERIPNLSEVENGVRAVVEMEKALDLAKAKAEELIKRANDRALPLADVDQELEVREAAPFTRRGHPAEMPYLSGLAEVVFGLSEGKAGGPFVGRNSAYIVRLKEKLAPDAESFETHKESIKNRILAERRNQAFQDYYENCKKKARVEIDEALFQSV